MIKIYINSILRDDIDPVVGAQLELSSDHRTDSKMVIRIPTGSDPISAGDYIKICDDSTSLFSGAISGLEQQIQGAAIDADRDERIYSLTMATNVDSISAKFVDLQFPSGASINQIVLGNHPGQAWYKSTFGEFWGIYEVRMADEGITLGVIDDFTNVTLSDPAYLWGSYIADVLDSLADAAGAWWELTPDNVFNMCSSDVPIAEAPFMLDTRAPISDIAPSDDTYTRYSAVRVEGGRGAGPNTIAVASKSAVFGWLKEGFSSFSTEKVVLSYAVHDIIALQIQVTPSGSTASPKIGWRGIDDDDTSIQVMAQYDSNELNAVNGYTFPDLSATIGQWDNWPAFFLNYHPAVSVVSRMVDQSAKNMLIAQRGGSGIIEHLINDSTITDFSTATVAAINFLKQNSKVAKTIKFKTYVSGIRPGMMFSAASIPYLGISGDYSVGSVVAEIVAGDENTVVWEYEIEASTVPYRDPDKDAVFSTHRIALRLGDDTPQTDGILLPSEVTVSISLKFEQYALLWSQITSAAKTWAEIDSEAKSWDEINAPIRSEFMGNYSTDYIKSTLARIFSGEESDGSKLCPNILELAGNSTSDPTNSASPTDTPIASGSDAYIPFYFPALTSDDSEASYSVAKLLRVRENEGTEICFSVPVSLTRSPLPTVNTPQGATSLSIAVTITVN